MFRGWKRSFETVELLREDFELPDRSLGPDMEWCEQACRSGFSTSLNVYFSVNEMTENFYLFTQVRNVGGNIFDCVFVR